jgi:hypothetical protein
MEKKEIERRYAAFKQSSVTDVIKITKNVWAVCAGLRLI